jgi:cytochrome P450
MLVGITILAGMRSDLGTSLPPGPNLPRPLLMASFVFRPTQFLEGLHRRYGDPFTMRAISDRTIVFTTDPEEIKRIFTGDPDLLHAGEGNSVLGPLLGSYSVLLLDGPDHMRQRKLLLPPFHGERMAAYAEVMRQAAEREVARWPVGEPFAVLPHTQAVTLEVIMRAVFGIDDSARLDALRAALRQVLEVATTRRRMLALALSMRGNGDRGAWARFRAASAAADAILYEEIRERRAAPPSGRDDVLSLLLQARHEDGSPMSDEELRDELMTLLVAGHETTATALAWALERLVRHPAVLERLVAEVREQGTEGEYLDAVVKETLRLRPVVPAVIRRLTGPMELGGYELPTGTFVSPSIYLTHRRPDVYPDPEAFRPERFLERPAGTYTWIPFGGGVRRCLGASFALFEMKVVLATVLERVQLRTLDARDEPITRRAITFAPRHEGRIVLAA